jgi:hypothetical protein
MSVAHAGSVPAARSSVLAWIAGGTLLLAAIVAVAIAVWPASEVDKAREDGEQLGAAVSALYAADSSAEVDAALTEMHAAASDARVHAGDAVAEQVADQEDALARAADGFVGSRTSTDDFEAELYQAELDIAVDDLANQAEDFRTTGPEVQQAFWEGYESGVAGE